MNEISKQEAEPEDPHKTYMREIGALLVHDTDTDKTLEERIWEFPQTD